METLSIFDFIQDGFEKYKQQESTDWRWSMASDYPEKNGLKVFSCFACGGGARWATSLLDARCLGVTR